MNDFLLRVKYHITCMNSEMNGQFGLVMELFLTEGALVFADFVFVHPSQVQQHVRPARKHL